MFIAALFITTKNWIQSKYSLTAKWINKLPYVYTMKYDSAIKKNELLIHTITTTHLKSIIISKRTQTLKKTTVRTINSIYMAFWKRQKCKDRNQIICCQGLGRDEEEWQKRGTKGLVGVMRTFSILIVVVAAIKAHRTIHLKGLHCTVCKFYLDKLDLK